MVGTDRKISTLAECAAAPNPPRPFLQELNERLVRLGEHLEETLKLSADMNSQLFGVLPTAEVTCKSDPKNTGCTGLLLEKLTSVEQLAFHLRENVHHSRQIL